jgi:hypothetical protein
VLGKLNSGTVFDQIFALPVGNPTVQAAFASAQQTISNLGGLGVTIGVPQLTSSSSSTSSSITTLYSLADFQDVVNPGVITFGPATLSVGALSSCSVASLPATTKPACSALAGNSLVLSNNDTNINVHSDFLYTIDTLATTTHTSTLRQIWTIAGKTTTSSVPEPATWTLLLTGFGMLGAMARRKWQLLQVSIRS